MKKKKEFFLRMCGGVLAVQALLVAASKKFVIITFPLVMIFPNKKKIISINGGKHLRKKINTSLQILNEKHKNPHIKIT